MSSLFDSLCHALTADSTLPAQVTEIHGLGCGILAAGFRPDFDQLSQQIAHYTGEPAPIDPNLLTFFEDSLRSLEADDFDFQLCLPIDDDYTLAERAESLSAWCLGFLHGFAAVQNPLSEEAQELLRDLAEISQLDSAALGDEELRGNDIEESELHYVELSEFVRMAVIGLFMDHNTATHKPASADHHARH